MKSDLIELDEKEIKNKIYEINGIPVMLDSDLAELYGCKNGTKDINKAVKRNINKFPSDFYFQLTKKEYNEILRFQNGTLELEQGKYSKYLPYVFTEQGIAMLASVLKTEYATEVSVKIIRTFVKMRHFIVDNYDLFKSLNIINNKLLDHDNKLNIYGEKIDRIFNKFEPKEVLLLKGQTYDAYSKILDIFKLAKDELILIDNYADNKVLNMISKLKVNIILITKDSKRLNELDIEKYNSQYSNLKLIRNNTFHDRYIIIDKKEVYHLGTSINNAGNGIFSINKLEDKFVINALLDKVGGILYE